MSSFPNFPVLGSPCSLKKKSLPAVKKSCYKIPVTQTSKEKKLLWIKMQLDLKRGGDFKQLFKKFKKKLN